MTQAKSKPTFFKTPEDFRKWLDKNHEREKELLIGFYKTGSGKPSITWPQSVDEALCFGWIDGVRKSIDEDSYTIRFTPRKSSSNWSAVNIKKMEELIKKDLVHAPGYAAYEKRVEAKSRIYSYERKADKLGAEFGKKFRANKKAWKFFNEQAPWYQKQSIHWVVGAKQEETRARRLEKLIKSSDAGKRL